MRGALLLVLATCTASHAVRSVTAGVVSAPLCTTCTVPTPEQRQVAYEHMRRECAGTQGFTVLSEGMGPGGKEYLWDFDCIKER